MICDFKIGNIWIEYHGFTKHGNFAYDCNNLDHLKEVERRKSTGKRMDEAFIYCWTITDLKKRKIIEDIGDLYLEFFNMKQFKECWERKINHEKFDNDWNFKLEVYAKIYKELKKNPWELSDEDLTSYLNTKKP
jgi:hypothetical protein